MPFLRDIDISNNLFNGTLPTGLCHGGHLQTLYLGNNSFEGPIPSSLVSCKSLVQASFRMNQFTSIPDGFGRNSPLQLLWAQRNQLVGELPKGLAVDSQLATLDLSENKLIGNISILEFSKLAQNLSFLNLAKNNFSGMFIPSTLGMCKLLYHVDLSYNSFTGGVPLGLANLSTLEILYLQGNKLTLLHPSIYLGFARTLRSLNLAENPWSASIANEIGSLKILQVLNLSYGGYIGSIPSTFGSLTQLEVLDLSYNNLTGVIPSELGELMTSLTSINVSFNRLSGSLPRAWVKILATDPTSFYGNPDLCLRYDANNVCIDVNKPSVHGIRSKFTLSTKVIVGVALGIIAIALLIYIGFKLRRCGHLQEEMIEEKEISEMNLTNEPWLLSFEEIMKITENLSDEYIIGRGAHGVVYKVKCISDAHPFIAVKKIIFTNEKTKMPHKSFWAEVKSVGKARHRNLVTLLGFIKRDEVGLLLYEYISKGNLHSALHNIKESDSLHLTWDTRLHIAKGVAHGLAYLHHDYDVSIVHRDIKSSNVLLDDDLEAHISDFGLAKVLDMQYGSTPSSLSTQIVLGTHGYIAPEVGCGFKAKPQVDVYSYGVLLLELLTGKEPTHDPSYGEASDVVAWMKKNVQLNKNKVDKSIFDPWLLQYSNDSSGTLHEMVSLREIGLLCTNKNSADRPTMRDVVKMLELLSSSIEKEDRKVNGKD